MRRSTVERIGVSRTASVGALAEVLESRRLLSANILTWHNNLARTGLNDSETQLTPADVNVASFGKLFSYPVDGQVYAQPLYVSNLAIPGKGTHNVVFVATERNSVYAFDADSAGHSGGLLWHVNLGTPATLPNPTIYPPGGRFGPNISPYMGITGTPVIDLGSDTMYVDAFTNDSGTTYNHRVHALDLTSGADKVAPVVVQATYPGDGVESDGTTVTFDPTRQLQRPALALLNGTVYVSYGSFSDGDPYHGWVLGFDANTLELQSAYNSTPNLLSVPAGPHADEGAFWQAGAGPSSDGSNLYLMSGNGDFDTNLDANGFPTLQDYGDSFIKLSTSSSTLSISDYFTPHNQQQLSDQDQDLGSAGPMVLPDPVGGAAHRHLLIGCGKQGVIYLIDTSNMGGFNSTTDNVVQEVSLGSGTWSNPAYFNGRIYFHGVSDVLKAFSISNGVLSTSPVAAGTVKYGYPGATPSISSNGTSNGIVWEIQSGGTLHAYDAVTLQELYNSNQAPQGRDSIGSYKNFIVPTVADGKVFVGSANSVVIFGLLTTPPPVLDTITGTGGNDAITLQKDGSNIVWTLAPPSGPPQVGQLAINDPSGLTINAGAGTETIVLDASNGDPLPNLLLLGGAFILPGSLSIGPGQKVVLSGPTGVGSLTVGGLTIDPNGALDIGNGPVYVNYTPSSPLAVLQGYLRGGQIISAQRGNPQWGIADVDQGRLQDPPGEWVLLQPELVGDTNGDGKVDFTDLIHLARQYGQSNADWAMGDFDYDGTVDFADLVALARNYATTLNPAAVAGTNAGLLPLNDLTNSILPGGLRRRRRH